MIKKVTEKRKGGRRGLISSIILSLSLASTLVLFQNCAGDLQKKKKKTSSSQTADTNGPSSDTNTGGSSGDNGPAEVVEVYGASFGINSFEATYANLKVITGIADDTCDTEYEAGKNSLPASNDLTTVNAAAQGATLKISACLCNEAIINNTNGGQARLMPGVNLNNQLGTAEKSTLTQGMMNAAWGANNSSIAPKSQEILNSTFDQLVGNGATTLQAAFGVCVTTLSSVGTNLL